MIDCKFIVSYFRHSFPFNKFLNIKKGLPPVSVTNVDRGYRILPHRSDSKQRYPYLLIYELCQMKVKIIFFVKNTQSLIFFLKIFDHWVTQERQLKGLDSPTLFKMILAHFSGPVPSYYYT